MEIKFSNPNRQYDACIVRIDDWSDEWLEWLWDYQESIGRTLAEFLTDDNKSIIGKAF